MRKPLSAPRRTPAQGVLAGIDWSFSTPFSVGRTGLPLFDARKYHWYPATYVPEIPYTLVEVLTSPGATVYDPFAGIGTTLYQSLQLGRVPFVTDVCMVSIQVIQAVWSLLSAKVNFERLGIRIEQIIGEFTVEGERSKRFRGINPHYDDLVPWFNSDTFDELTYLFMRIQDCRDPATSALLNVASSSALKAVCAQDRGSSCIADNMLPSDVQRERYRPALERIRSNAHMMLKGLARFRSSLPASSAQLVTECEAGNHILLSDARTAIKPLRKSVDLVVTSPPYPNMTDYCTNQRLSFYWRGADPMSAIQSEIGARRRRFSGKSISEYEIAMKAALDSIAEKLRPSALCCVVLPTFTGDRHNNVIRKAAIDDVLSHLDDCGFVLDQTLDRLLPVRRRLHNQKWTTLEREKISIYRKGS